MEYIVSDIKYDTDGEIIDLPIELKIMVPSDINDAYDIDLYISDEISNLTGFCHKGFATIPIIHF